MRGKGKKKSALPFHQQQKPAAPPFRPGPGQFPLSIWSVLVSFAFWCIIGLVAIKVFQYAAVYRSLDDDDFSGTCKTPFHEDSEKNLNLVNNYSMGIAKPYLQRIGIRMITKHCDCDVRSIDTQIYPEHVAYFDNKAYRPIIIQTIIEEFGSVLWLEPSSVIKSIHDLQMLKYRGNRNFFLWEEPAYQPITAYTHPGMFNYLAEKRCMYKDIGMMDMQTMVFYRTKETWFGVMKPWLKCALNPDCIAPKGARSTECFHYKKPKMTGCHWYDQSALSIIVNRAFQFDKHQDQFVVPRLTSYDHEEIVYHFPEQPWSYTELVLCFTMPIVVLIALFFLYQRRARMNRMKYRTS